MKYIEIKAPAKINIGLFIISKRNDGYHNLSTLFYPINSLYDLITIEDSNKFEFLCDDQNIPTNEDNLVVKAKNLLEKTFSIKINVKITLNKKIPSQAGLGGGSSDAAAVLKALNKKFNLEISYEMLNDLALKLGSDVPFFIRSQPAIGTSRGEILKDINIEIKEPILIVKPNISISTKEAFENIKPSDSQFNFNSIVKDNVLDYPTMREMVRNDFENYAFKKYPELKLIKDQLYEFGSSFALMSGSGSALYGIFKDMDSAKNAKNKFSKYYFCWIDNPDY